MKKYHSPIIQHFQSYPILAQQQYSVALSSCDTKTGCTSSILSCPEELGVFKIEREGNQLQLVSPEFTFSGNIDDNGDFTVSASGSRPNSVNCLEGFVITFSGNLNENGLSGTFHLDVDEANDGPSGPCATSNCPDQYTTDGTISGILQ